MNRELIYELIDRLERAVKEDNKGEKWGNNGNGNNNTEWYFK